MKPFLLAGIMLLSLSGATTDLDSVNDCLTAEEQKLYELLMQYRKSKNLPTIPLSGKLTQVARLHAEDLNAHYDMDNSTCNPHSWSSNGKWVACCYTDDHKNPKCMWRKPQEINGYPGNGYEIAYYSSEGANATEGIEGWKLSPGHNPVMINEGIWKSITWKAVGVAVRGDYGLIWFGELEDQETIKSCN